MQEIVLPSDLLKEPVQANAWQVLLELAPHLGDAWTLVGGQMVMLHQVERSRSPQQLVERSDFRISMDIDVVVNIRVSRLWMSHVHKTITRYGFEQLPGDGSHRYLLPTSRLIFDVLAPDNLGAHFPKLGHGRTLQAVGSGKALKRTEAVTVRYEESSSVIYRPNLVGAMLMKSAVSEQVGPGGRRQSRDLKDVFLLASLLTDHDVRTASLSRKERALLRKVVHRRPLTSMASVHEAGIARLERFLKQETHLRDSSSQSRQQPSYNPVQQTLWSL